MEGVISKRIHLFFLRLVTRSVCSSYFGWFFMCRWTWIKSVCVCLRRYLLLTCVSSHSSTITSGENDPLSNCFRRELAGKMDGDWLASGTLVTNICGGKWGLGTTPPVCGHLSHQPFVSLQNLKVLGQFPMALSAVPVLNSCQPPFITNSVLFSSSGNSKRLQRN